jgi:hypothetical protein
MGPLRPVSHCKLLKSKNSVTSSALTIQINYLASDFLLPTSGDSQRVHKRSTCGGVVQSPRDDPDALRVFAVAVVAIMHVAAELENQTVR